MPALLYLLFLGLGWLPVSLLARKLAGIEISPWLYFLGCLAVTGAVALSLISWDRRRIGRQRSRATEIGIGMDSTEVRKHLGHPLAISDLDFERKADRSLRVAVTVLFLAQPRSADFSAFLNSLSGRSSRVPREATTAWIFGRSFALLERNQFFWPSYPLRFFLGVPQRHHPSDFVLYFDVEQCVCEISGLSTDSR